MEKEDALKAGHWVEPLRGMQFCAAAGVVFIKDAMAVRRIVEASDAISFALVVPPRELKINEGFQNAQWVCLVATEWTFCLSNSKAPGC